MRSNIKDVARRAGVSIATVSHVVNNTHYVSEEKKHRVLSAIEGLNYKPNNSARSLRSKKSSAAVAMVCSQYAQHNPRLLNRTLQSLTEIADEQQWSMAVLFGQPGELIRVCREQNTYDHVFIITDDMSAYRSMLQAKDNVHFMDMGLFSITGDRASQDQMKNTFHASLHYYTELSNLISDHADDGSCFLLSMEQGKIMRELFLNNINYASTFQCAKVISPEISAAYIELMELLSGDRYSHVTLTDYKFALGAVKLLLLKPELIHSKVSISFFNYDSVFEDFGLPVRELPFLLSRSTIEEFAGTVFEG